MTSKRNSPNGPGKQWARETWALSGNATVLSRLMQLLTADTRTAKTSWHAATTIMFGTDRRSVTSAYLQHVHGLHWRVSEARLLAHAMPQLVAPSSTAPPSQNASPWKRDRITLADATRLNSLARLLAVPAPPGATWRAAVVIAYAPTPLGVVHGHVWLLQDQQRPLAEEVLLAQAHAGLARRYRHETQRGGEA